MVVLAKENLSPNENLKLIIENAQGINTILLNDTYLKKLIDADTHLRPTAKGVSLVSINELTPQIRARDIEEFLGVIKFDTHHKSDPEEPKRNTPEKALQSWLISDAYIHRGRMIAIEKLVHDKIGASNDSEVFFVTDEIGLVSEETGKLVKCDILAIRRELKKDGSINWVPMQLELKSARKLTELIDQLENYEKLFEKSRTEFETLFGLLVAPVFGGKIVFGSAKLEKWIIWPSCKKPTPETTRKIAAKGIKEIQYQSNYSFQ
jgi:hypothetical protein